MKNSLSINQVLIIKCMMILFFLNPTNTVDAKIEPHSIEEASIENINKNTSVNKVEVRKKRKERKKWKELSYGEKSFRISLWMLLCLLVSPVTLGFSFILAMFFILYSIRLALRSLRDKEEGISKEKRNRGLTISLVTLLTLVLIAGLVVLLVIAL